MVLAVRAADTDNSGEIDFPELLELLVERKKDIETEEVSKRLSCLRIM
eukprot:SAG31_NODE_705_length_12695_cov_3.147007_14_plen_48_part_00